MQSQAFWRHCSTSCRGFFRRSYRADSSCNHQGTADIAPPLALRAAASSGKFQHNDRQSMPTGCQSCSKPLLTLVPRFSRGVSLQAVLATRSPPTNTPCVPATKRVASLPVASQNEERGLVALLAARDVLVQGFCNEVFTHFEPRTSKDTTAVSNCFDWCSIFQRLVQNRSLA